MSGAKFQAVHYKGATPALTDVIAGHIQMMFVSVGTAVPQWRAGKVKFIAVGAGKRMPQLPEVPTVAESGVPGYEAVSWFGLFGPAGMPGRRGRQDQRRDPRHASPTRNSARHFSTSSISSRSPGRRSSLRKFIKDEEPKWRKIIQDAKIKVE